MFVSAIASGAGGSVFERLLKGKNTEQQLKSAGVGVYALAEYAVYIFGLFWHYIDANELVYSLTYQ